MLQASKLISVGFPAGHACGAHFRRRLMVGASPGEVQAPLRSLCCLSPRRLSLSLTHACSSGATEIAPTHHEVHVSGFIHLMQYVMTIRWPGLLCHWLQKSNSVNLRKKKLLAPPTGPWEGKGSAGLGKAGSRDLDVPGALSACHVSTGLCESAPPSPVPGRLQAVEETSRVPDVSLVRS